MNVKPIVFLIFGLFLMSYSFFTLDPGDALLRIFLSPGFLRLIGSLLLVAAFFTALFGADKR